MARSPTSTSAISDQPAKVTSPAGAAGVLGVQADQMLLALQPAQATRERFDAPARAFHGHLVEYAPEHDHVATATLIAQPRRHVHRTAEVVEAVVGGHRDHRPDVHARA